MNTRMRMISLVVLLAALLFVVAAPHPAAAAPTCTADCYVDPAGNDANDGASATTPLRSIQLAIDTVSAGGTVHLSAGTFFENAPTGWRELFVTKSLTLEGAGSGVTIIELPVKTNGIEIFGANLSVTLRGLTLTRQAANATAAGFNVRVAELPSSFTSITFDDVESAYAGGRNVILGGAGTYSQVTVTDSNFHHAGAWGFSIAGTASNITVTDSHFDNNGTDAQNHAIGFDLEAGGGSTNVSITGGTFNNNGSKTVNGSKGINIVKTTNATISGIEARNNFDGVIIWEYRGTTSGIEIVNSTLTGNGRGITIGSETGMTVDDVTISGNDLSGNGAGVLVYRAAGWGEGAISDLNINRNNLSGNPGGGIAVFMPYETHNGTCNWWGDASGPGPVGPGTGSNVSSGVTYSPWLYSSDLEGDCYVGGTITVVKQAGDVGDQFEFDPSWSEQNFLLYSGESYVTAPPLQPGTYSVSEVNLPPGWSLENAICDNLATVDEENIAPTEIPVEDGDEWQCTFTNVYTPPPTNTCPVEAADNVWTDLLGEGMGGPNKHRTRAKVVIPNWQNVEELYGQMSAKAMGLPKYVRFVLPGKNNSVQVNSITSPADHDAGNFWYGAYLPAPARYVTGRWFLQGSGAKNHIPRAIVLYTTYSDPVNSYVNVWDTYDAWEGEVYWDVSLGWAPYREIVVPIAAPLGPTDLHVELAVVDNNKDTRPVWVTVEAGNKSQTQMPTGPNAGDTLNLMNFHLMDVAEGTDEIVIKIYSPSPALDGVEGDSAALVGMAAHYTCEPMD